MNSHIKVNRIDRYVARKYGIDKYDAMVEFSRWLKEQQVRFENGKRALQVYTGEVELATVKVQKPEARTEQSFRGRRPLNNHLRQHGYTWHKIAPMNENEESRYGENYRWQLFSSDDRPLTVDQALAEIGA